MSEVQDSSSNSTQQQQQQQQQSFTENKINSAESEKLYLEMKEAWLQRKQLLNNFCYLAI